jgi:hypothetical protein
MSDAAARGAALQFYYFGFYEALRRYRRAALIGWAIISAGFVGILLGWDFAAPPGLYHLSLCLGAIGAALALIPGNIASLSLYVRIPFPVHPAGGEAEPWQGAVDELQGLMKVVEDGGWQEAFDVLNRLERMGERYDLPPLEHGST